MKAALISGPGEIRLATVNDPSVQDNEILVKVKACGICGTDIHTYKTGGTATPEKPLILGHEFSGEIVDMGSGVDGLKVGDAVFGIGYRNCGECHWCRQGQAYRCPNPAVPGEGMDGAFAELVVVPNPMLGQLLFHVPETMDWEQAATMEPLAVACYAVRRARIQPDDTVVVLGAGMIGQGIAQVCKALGAASVIVSEPCAARLDTARRLGADVAIDPGQTDPVEAVTEATAGEMANVIFECSGSPVAFRQAPHLARAFGRIMQVGMFEKTLEIAPDLMSFTFQFRNLTVRGCGGQRWDMALELAQAGKVRTADLITHRFSLDEAGKAFDTQINSDEAIKVIVKP